jgi:YYY domain-containing protein
MEPNEKNNSQGRALIFDLLLIGVLLVGAYFRLAGFDWGEYQYLHPDERFLVWVGSDISPVKCLDESYPLAACPPEQKSWLGWGEYFDTVNSTLNPHNRGHKFYVYGTLPLFIARYIVEWVYGHSGFAEMTNVGRPLSAFVDLLTVFLVYLIGSRVYARRVGIIAAAFSALVVMQIQLSHYFTVDTFLNFFTWLAIYFAVRVAGQPWDTQMVNAGVAEDDHALETSEESGEAKPDKKQAWVNFIKHPYFRYSIAFGFALGSAVASKLSSAPVAIMLPAAFGLTFAPLSSGERQNRFWKAFFYLLLAAVVSLLIFRIFQPYAFSGPGFFGMLPNSDWVSNIREQRLQAAGDVDFPPAMQWARRPIWFSGMNLVLWGLGLPLGILAWAGFLWVGLRILKGDWVQHILLWGWTAFYFLWQSLAFNPTMRYQLPIYPALAIFAGWIVIRLWDYVPKYRRSEENGALYPANRKIFQILAVLIGGFVLLATFLWAFSFTRIYERQITRIEASRWIFQHIPGSINLQIQTNEGTYNHPIPFPYGQTISPGQPYFVNFIPKVDGFLESVYLPYVTDLDGNQGAVNLKTTVNRSDNEELSISAEVISDFQAQDDLRGEAHQLIFDQAYLLEKDVEYRLKLEINSDHGTIALAGSATANESSWDDGLPYRVDGFDGYSGIYQPGLNFEMYWEENEEKLARIKSILDEADYLFISSSRQWGSLPRLSERYPLTTEYYRHLLGCPPDRSIEWCYNVAEPGMFSGDLDFELVKVFHSDPGLGEFRINDQFSEEAFTVYDHPKVFVFQKSGGYNSQQVSNILDRVDLSKVIHVTPKQADSHPANLMLPLYRWAEQRAGGTWAELFDLEAWYNQTDFLATLVWYLSLTLLGLIVYPMVRLALPGLSDKGYPFARLVGLLLLSYLVWVAGSLRVPFTRLTITSALAMLVVIGGVFAYRQRRELLREVVERKKYFLLIEGLFLAFFIFDLVIRIGNPDLWHPWKGGEKPMDFSYLNAVLKSTSFPPYDPWYAGGYLNYYYYGFLLVGSLVKWLGIVPAVAYNLIIPTIFAIIALGAFSVGWNLMGKRSPEASPPKYLRLWVGLAAALGTAVLGNLGTVRMIWQGYQRIAAPGGTIDGAGLLARVVWGIRGAVMAFSGTPLPYSIGDWYWIPSRAIPAPNEVEPITEFPFFTVLYGDPHAHLFALPVTLLVLAFALSIILSHGKWKGVLGVISAFLLGGLAISTLRSTNTWDFYPYLALGCIAVGYAVWIHFTPEGSRMPLLRELPVKSQRILVLLGGVIFIVALSYLFSQPFSAWYGQGYTQVEVWKGTRTPLLSYLTHWGLFLFLIVSWMVWETYQWLATTPMSSLRKLNPFKLAIELLLIVLLVLVALLLYLGVRISWLVLPLAAWSGVLLLRSGMPDTKRFVLFLVGTGLTLTLMVEVIVLRGDIARMNTVFKFYLQVWMMFGISAASGLGWLIMSFPNWQSRWRNTWQIAFLFLVAGAALYPFMGGLAKIEDRMAPQTPFTLDGMAFMEYAEYAETWGNMDLSQDYRAIRWMQQNITGSPVIVEANLRNLYRWGSRFSIYTGLPGVVGWEWHQQQQRALLPGNWVSDRIAEVDNFYLTTDFQQAHDFLKKYDVRYIVVGQQERGHYPGEGLTKFAAADGVLWRSVYEDGETVIYEVLAQ